MASVAASEYSAQSKYGADEGAMHSPHHMRTLDIQSSAIVPVPATKTTLYSTLYSTGVSLDARKIHTESCAHSLYWTWVVDSRTKVFHLAERAAHEASRSNSCENAYNAYVSRIAQ